MTRQSAILSLRKTLKVVVDLLRSAHQADRSALRQREDIQDLCASNILSAVAEVDWEVLIHLEDGEVFCLPYRGCLEVQFEVALTDQRGLQVSCGDLKFFAPFRR